MKFSVIIPAYNAGKTIGMTLDSVLAQTLVPDEILVFDDGSTDDTPAVLESYKSRVTVFRQANQGVAHARNFLCAQARGDILAFLDADDLWHPRYLAVQNKCIQDYPDAVAYFTEHENLVGYGNYQWQNNPVELNIVPDLISPKDFILQYNETPLSFQMSCFCLRKIIFKELGDESFPVKISGADDTYLHNLLPLLGSVLHTPKSFAVYRIIESSISENRLKMALSVVEAFEMLERRYQTGASKNLYQTFKTVFASRRRNCGKYLMGAGRAGEARRQFLLASRMCASLESVAKSIGMYFFSHFPQNLQPQWPSVTRDTVNIQVK